MHVSQKKRSFREWKNTRRFCWKMCTISHAVYCLLWFWHFLHVSSGRMRCEWPTYEHTHTHTDSPPASIWKRDLAACMDSRLTLSMQLSRCASQSVRQSGNLCLVQSRCLKCRSLSAKRKTENRRCYCDSVALAFVRLQRRRRQRCGRRHRW